MTLDVRSQAKSVARRDTVFHIRNLSTQMALKVSSILPIFWPKKFLIFKQLFLRRVQVSYNVVSYNKNKVYELLAVGPI